MTQSTEAPRAHDIENNSLWLAHADEVQSDVFNPGERFDVIVLGAGVTGLTTAVLLAQAGKKVGVLEARTVGAVATGNTTAKLSLLHGAKLGEIVADHGVSVARAYVEANRAGQAWLVEFCRKHGLTVDQRDAFTYASKPESVPRLRREHSACREAGLDAVLAEIPELPFPTYGAVQLRKQYQFNPVEVLHALSKHLRAAGGSLVTRARALEMKENQGIQVTATQGSWFARDVVIATGFPVLNQNLLFARLEAHRSYALAVQTSGEKPRGMYLSMENPARSLRTARVDDELYLLVGGQGHVVGREESEHACIKNLLAWAQANFDDVIVKNIWSAQDYSTLDGLPLLASTAIGQGRAFFATGYDKWGMSNGPAAALALSASLLESRSAAWASTLYERTTGKSRALTQAISRNGQVALQMARGWCQATPKQVMPNEGQGFIVHDGLKRIGVCQVGGQRHEVSAICPHLGGVLQWNDAARSWDCPLHGSRFAHNGELLEGPATRSLTKER